mmetsp:Transcript_14802/g.24080  ORF Transcript_14802/g.24080 Transcript_14802/m.24080 type:complete len:255 (-) Transcript_14802:2256-3020(-)
MNLFLAHHKRAGRVAEGKRQAGLTLCLPQRDRYVGQKVVKLVHDLLGSDIAPALLVAGVTQQRHVDMLYHLLQVRERFRRELSAQDLVFNDDIRANLLWIIFQKEQGLAPGQDLWHDNMRAHVVPEHEQASRLRGAEELINRPHILLRPQVLMYLLHLDVLHRRPDAPLDPDQPAILVIHILLTLIPARRRRYALILSLALHTSYHPLRSLSAPLLCSLPNVNSKEPLHPRQRLRHPQAKSKSTRTPMTTRGFS